MDDKTLTEKLLDLSTALQIKFNEMINEKAEDLLTEDKELEKEGTYFLYYDRDTVDVGVGSVVVREEMIQDEEQAEKDAKEALIIEVANNDDALYTLIEDNKITSLLAEVLRSL